MSIWQKKNEPYRPSPPEVTYALPAEVTYGLSSPKVTYEFHSKWSTGSQLRWPKYLIAPLPAKKKPLTGTNADLMALSGLTGLSSSTLGLSQATFKALLSYNFYIDTGPSRRKWIAPHSSILWVWKRKRSAQSREVREVLRRGPGCNTTTKTFQFQIWQGLSWARMWVSVWWIHPSASPCLHEQIFLKM